jgi:hypothetical protein
MMNDVLNILSQALLYGTQKTGFQGQFKHKISLGISNNHTCTLTKNWEYSRV